VAERLPESTIFLRPTLRHVKHFLGGAFRHAAQLDYLDSGRANPVRPVEIPTFATNGCEGRRIHSRSRHNVASAVRACRDAVATAAYSGLRLGELRALTGAYTSPTDDDSLAHCSSRAQCGVATSVTRKPQSLKLRSGNPELAEKLNAHRKACGSPLSGRSLHSRGQNTRSGRTLRRRERMF